MIPSSNPCKKVNREEKSIKISSIEVPIRASTYLKSKEKLQVRIDSSSLSSRIKNTKNSQNPISPRPASPNLVSKAELEKSSSLKPLRSPMKKNSGTGLHHTVNLSRTTCSTAIKVARVPDSLEINEPKMKLCTYSYCSLHNQKQEATLPVVKCFLRTKRQSFEARNRMKPKKKLSRSKNDQNKAEGAERSPDEVEIVDIVGGIKGMILEDREISNQLQESYSVTSFDDYDDDENSKISMDEIEVFNDAEEQGEHFEIEKHGSSEGETNLFVCLQSDYVIDGDEAEPGPYPQNSPQKFDDFFGKTKVNSLSICKHVEHDSNIIPENEEEQCQQFDNGSLQSTVDIPNSPKLEVQCDNEHDTKAKMANSGLCEHSKHEYNNESQLNFTRKFDTDGDVSEEFACKKEKVTNSTSLILESPLVELTNMPKSAREFNPRAPRFLPPKTEAEAEKVNLKHQPTEERKTSEEWMIDYALRQTLRRMAPARKRKVSRLVAAFESVIQQELKMS